jgi:hypothetical protein
MIANNPLTRPRRHIHTTEFPLGALWSISFNLHGHAAYLWHPDCYWASPQTLKDLDRVFLLQALNAWYMSLLSCFCADP